MDANDILKILDTMIEGNKGHMPDGSPYDWSIGLRPTVQQLGHMREAIRVLRDREAVTLNLLPVAEGYIRRLLLAVHGEGWEAQNEDILTAIERAERKMAFMRQYSVPVH